MDIQQSLIERIHQGDRGGANALLDAWASEHGYERLLAEVLDPTLILIGEEWSSSETFTLAQVYVAAKVLRLCLASGCDARDRNGLHAAHPGARTWPEPRQRHQLDAGDAAQTGVPGYRPGAGAGNRIERVRRILRTAL